MKDENRPGKPIMASKPEMGDSVNLLILADGRITVEDIS